MIQMCRAVQTLLYDELVTTVMSKGLHEVIFIAHVAQENS